MADFNSPPPFLFLLFFLLMAALQGTAFCVAPVMAWEDVLEEVLELSHWIC